MRVQPSINSCQAFDQDVHAVAHWVWPGRSSRPGTALPQCGPSRYEGHVAWRVWWSLGDQLFLWNQFVSSWGQAQLVSSCSCIPGVEAEVEGRLPEGLSDGSGLADGHRIWREWDFTVWACRCKEYGSGFQPPGRWIRCGHMRGVVLLSLPWKARLQVTALGVFEFLIFETLVTSCNPSSPGVSSADTNHIYAILCIFMHLFFFCCGVIWSHHRGPIFLSICEPHVTTYRSNSKHHFFRHTYMILYATVHNMYTACIYIYNYIYDIMNINIYIYTDFSTAQHGKKCPIGNASHLRPCPAAGCCATESGLPQPQAAPEGSDRGLRAAWQRWIVPSLDQAWEPWSCKWLVIYNIIVYNIIYIYNYIYVHT